MPKNLVGPRGSVASHFTKSATTPVQKVFGSVTKFSGPGLDDDSFDADLITSRTDLEGDQTLASGCNKSSGTLPLFYNHDPSKQVGDCQFRRVGDKIVIRGRLIPKGTTPEGDLARVLVKQGFGCGVSAGFLPTKITPIKGTSGKRYEAYELIEASIVGIPCDDHARITARSFSGGGVRLPKSEMQRRARALQDAQPPAAAAAQAPLSVQVARAAQAHATAIQNLQAANPNSRENRLARARALAKGGV